MVELTKPIVRRHGNLVIRIAREGISIKEYRRRSWLGPVPWGSIELDAAKIETGFAAAQNPRKPKREARCNGGALKGRRMAGGDGPEALRRLLAL